MGETNWMAKLRKLDGAVKEDVNPFATGLTTGVPSVDFIYGKTWVLPAGFTEILYGLPKCGKSVLSHLRIAALHRSDPKAWALKFDTEMRSKVQLSREDQIKYGIDPERLIIIEGNDPAVIFDQFRHEILEMVKDGLPLKYACIDSISTVSGRRTMEQEKMETQQRGDWALTIQTGLGFVLPIIREHNIAFTLVAQARAEQDALEQKRGHKVRMHAGFALQHFGEYFVFVERDRTVAGKTDLLGHKLENAALTDSKDEAEKTAHKICVEMVDSSMGIGTGRTGRFTFDFDQLKPINTHEEIYVLGVGRGIIKTPTQGYYEYGGKKWHGEKAIVQHMADNPTMQAEIVQQLRAMDLPAPAVTK